ncbi:cold-shock protein [Xanthobacter sp. TB0139]|uniref:cold-shock protein n=1 Tax=Xanthobacter sp. TB0139 TaxID=3459178 RepID=UPI00403A5047
MGADTLRPGPHFNDLPNESKDAVSPLEELSGTIKWFDASKGYGFASADDGGSDILIHVTCLRRDGYDTALEGARIICEATQRIRGRQAFRILSLDLSTAIHPGARPCRTHVQVEPTSGLEKATVKWFNRLRGFGFLTQGDDSPDIFVHMETMRRFGLTELRPGQCVQVRYGDSEKGRMASEVRAMPTPEENN